MRRALARIVVPAVLAGCGDNVRECDPGIGPVLPSEGACTADCVDSFVVAHEDDDLLFMNPDIIADWQQGHAIHVIFVTAGELYAPGDEAYWMGREQGSVAAYSFLVGDDQWSFDLRDVATSDGGVFHVPTYVRPRVTLQYLRLGDYQTQCLWEQIPGCSALNPHAMELPYVAVTKESQQITRAGLVDVLATLLADSTRISSQDSTALYFDMLGGPDPHGRTDYWDHYYSALFTLTAAVRVQADANRYVEMSSYRGYTINAELPNVPLAQACSKLQVFAHYAVHDSAIVEPDDVAATLECPECVILGGYGLMSPSSWQRRQYGAKSVRGSGRLSDGSRCITREGALGPCEDAPRWTVTDRNQLVSDDGRCLVDEQPIRVGDCARSPASTFYVTTSGQIRTEEADCLTSLADGSPEIVRSRCGGIGQHWRLDP